MRYDPENPGPAFPEREDPHGDIVPGLQPDVVYPQRGGKDWQEQPKKSLDRDRGIGHVVATVIAITIFAFILAIIVVLGIGILNALWGVFFG